MAQAKTDNSTLAPAAEKPQHRRAARGRNSHQLRWANAKVNPARWLMSLMGVGI
jgi:hypothetical protein